jgi:hypothetical protein
MDGHFVPNLSMGPVVVRALKRVTRLPLDVHLMIDDPARYAPAFVDAGADHISFHVECFLDKPDGARALLEWLGERGVGRGLALNPPTPVEPRLRYLDRLDLVLFGRFTGCGEHGDVRALLHGFADEIGVPAVMDLPIGHEPDNWTLPLGVRARLDATRRTLELLEPAVQ